MFIFQCISGFRQNIGMLSGIVKLSERLRKAGFADGFEKRVLVNSWRCPWEHIAEYYSVLAEMYLDKLTVCVFAYSWGAGYGAIELAKQLSKNQISVRAMVLCDPVYRHPNILLRFTSLLKRDSALRPYITIPHNVKEVFSFHQRTNKPQGHRLIGENGTKLYPSYLVRDCTHQKMDDSWRFHSLCLEVSKRVINNESLDNIITEDLTLKNYF